MSPAADNPLFRKLTIIAGCFALSSAATWIVTSAAGLSTAPDGIVLLCFFTGLLASLVFLSAGRGSRPLIRKTLPMVGVFALTLLTWISFRWTGLSYGPDDCLFVFVLPGFILAAIATIVDGSGSLRGLFSLTFLRVFSRSLIPVLIYWSVIALLGSRMVAWLFETATFERDLWSLRLPENARESIRTAIMPFVERSHLHGEEEWFQISLVLAASSLTLLTWHRGWHRPAVAENFPEPEAVPVINPGSH